VGGGGDSRWDPAAGAPVDWRTTVGIVWSTTTTTTALTGRATTRRPASGAVSRMPASGRAARCRIALKTEGERVATGCLTRALGDRAHPHRRHHRYGMRRRRRSRTCGALSRVRGMEPRVESWEPRVESWEAREEGRPARAEGKEDEIFSPLYSF
jgi:hypothetical protein